MPQPCPRPGPTRDGGYDSGSLTWGVALANILGGSVDFERAIGLSAWLRSTAVTLLDLNA